MPNISIDCVSDCYFLQAVTDILKALTGILQTVKKRAAFRSITQVDLHIVTDLLFEGVLGAHEFCGGITILNRF